MTIRLAAASLLLGLTAASCTENGPAPDAKPTAILPEGIQGGGLAPADRVVIASPGLRTEPINPQATGNGLPPLGAAVPLTRPPADKEDVVAPPKDAQWTIYCAVIGGDGHVERARALKRQLASVTKADGRTQWYVIHGENESTLYYGFYKDNDRVSKEGVRAQADRAYLQALTDAVGEHPLQVCYFLRLDSQQAEEIPEYNLANYPRTEQRYWTLQVAAFTADKERKQAAVDAVKEFRKEGVQAYYYHGEAVSSVCVGIWPMSAVREQTGGNLKGNAGSADPNQPLFVSNIPLSQRLSQPLAPDGQKMKTMSPNLVINDPSLLAATRRYPEHAINGYNLKRKAVNPKTGMVEDLFDPSILVLMPEAKKPTFTGPSANNPSAAWLTPVADPIAQPRPVAPAQPQLPGVGRLRSTGD